MCSSKTYGHFLILAYAVTACTSISVFAALVDIPIGIISSTVGLKICAKTVAIEKYKPIFNKQ